MNSNCRWKGEPDYNGAQNMAALGRSINMPGGSSLACRVGLGVKEYIQLNLFSENLGLPQTPTSV